MNKNAADRRRHGCDQRALTEAGLLAFVVENRIHVVPPCTITAEQVAQGLAILMRSLLALPARRSREGPDTVARRRACTGLRGVSL
nr:Uncharacterised protein [Klebsiella pneumoniae]